MGKTEATLQKMSKEIVLQTASIKSLVDGQAKAESRFDKLETDVTKIKDRLSWIRGVMAAVAVALGLGAIGVWWTLTSNMLELQIEKTARNVVREELQYLRTFTQQGAFNAENRVAVADRDLPTFQWPLQIQVIPENVILLVAEMTELQASVAVSAKLVQEGQACEMTLHGSAKNLNALEYPISAQVTLSYRE